MDALHGGDDAELSEARNIGGVDVLRMLDAPAQVLLIGVGLEGVFEDVEGFAIGAVADGVDAELEAVLDGEFGGLAYVGGIVGVEAAAIGLVGVGRQQPGAAGAEGAIDGAFDGAHGKEIVARADDLVAVEIGGELFVRRAQHHPDAHAQFVRVGHLLEDVDGGEGRAGVFESGDAFGERFVDGEADGFVGFGEAVGGGAFGLVLGAGLADDAVRALAEQAGGRAFGVLQDFSARRDSGSAR